MSTIPRTLVDGYVDAINGVSDALMEYVELELESIEWSSLDELRERVYEILLPNVKSAAELAESISSAYYNAMREVQVGSDWQATPANSFNSEAFRVVTRAAGKTTTKSYSPGQFKQDLVNRASWEVKHAAGANIIANARSDPKKPKWARVPQGLETCPFCIMLAGRGFDYHSASSAGGDGNHYHANCDCAVVQGYGSNPSVEGYDVAEYADIYNRNAVYDEYGRIGLKATLAKMRTEIDYRQLINDNIDYTYSSRESYGTQIVPLNYESTNIIKQKQEWRDLVVHDTLAIKSYKVLPLSNTAPDGYSNIDLILEDKLYEIKSPLMPKGATEKQIKSLDYIQNNFEKAVHQFRTIYKDDIREKYNDGKIRVILNTYYRQPIDVTEFKKEVIKQKQKNNIHEVIWVSGFNKMERI